MSTKPLRLKEIRICGYRAFPHPTAIRLNSKNLLLFGENGSGKSSVGKSIRDFLDFRETRVEFDKFKYRFANPPRDDRKIELIFDNDTTAPLEWNERSRTETHSNFDEMSRARAWLDYRSVWRISEVVGKNDHVEIFTPLVEEILTSCLPLSGGNETFGAKWKEIINASQTKPKKFGSGYGRVSKLNEAITQFNNWIDTFLPTLENKTNEFLEKFASWTKLKLTRKTITSYNSRSRHNKFHRGSVHLQMLFHEAAPLSTPSEFINESRMTAIGLCLYLAGMSLSIPPRRTDGTTYPRLLVLDDVLLSLDMAHRLPLLSLLKGNAFKDWQILLLTHDRAWYEIGKQQLSSEEWTYCELFLQRIGDYEQPLLRNDKDHLDWALDFLQQGHIKAAAVHIRTKFEQILKRACQELGIPVKYNPDPRKTSANDLWGAVMGYKWKEIRGKNYHRQKDGTVKSYNTEAHEHPLVPQPLAERIKHSLSWVMNPLSHDQSIDRHSTEIEDAIFAISDLEDSINFALEAKEVQPATIRQKIIELLYKRVT